MDRQADPRLASFPAEPELGLELGLEQLLAGPDLVVLPLIVQMICFLVFGLAATLADQIT